MATSQARQLDTLRIALVHESLAVPGGSEKVLYELHQLFPQAPIFTSLYRPEKFPEFKDAKIITSGLNHFSFLRNRHQITIPLLPYVFEQFDLSDFDIVISSSSAAAKGVLTRPETIHICYCHTPMRWAWLPYLDKRASSSLLRRLSAHYLRVWDVASANRVDYWVANSQTIANRIKKFYRREATVIYPPVAIESHEPNAKSEDFYLTVGRLIPGNYKRTDLIIEGVKKAGVPLKIVGDGPLLPDLKKLAGRNSPITFLGRVSDAERNALYKSCKAFVFAAEEDFGIVPIEAMSYGKPVIAYGRGGASETVIDGETGILFHEQTSDALALAMQRFETKTFDPIKIMRHAQKYATPRFHQEVCDFVLHVLKDKEK